MSDVENGEDTSGNTDWDSFVDGKVPESGDNVKDTPAKKKNAVKVEASADAEAGTEEDDDTDKDEAGEADTTESPDADSEVPPVPDEPADPWAEVPEGLREEHQKQAEKLAKFEHENRSNRARVAALQKKVDSLSAKEEVPQTPKEPPVKTLDAFFKEDDDWKKFKDDFEDVAKPIEAAISRSVDGLRQRLEKAEKLAETLAESLQQQQSHSELEALNKKAGDWHQVISANQDEFNFFLDDPDAPKPIRHLRSAIQKANFEEIVDSDAVAWLITDFKSYLASKNPPAPAKEQRKPEPKSKPAPAPLSPKREKQLSSAVSVAPKTAPVPGRRSADDLPDTDDRSLLWNIIVDKLEKTQAR